MTAPGPTTTVRGPAETAAGATAARPPEAGPPAPGAPAAGLLASILALALGAAACAAAGSGSAGTTGRESTDYVPRSEEWITIRDFRHVEAVAATDLVVYFGTTAGLERFDPLRGRWLPPLTAVDGLPDDRVTALVAEPGGDGWVGTRRGLVRVLAFGDEVTRVFGPPAAPVDALAYDRREGRLWARVAGAWWTGRGDALTRASGPPSGALRSAVPASDLDPFAVPWTDPSRVRSPAVPDRLFRLTVVDRDTRGDWYAGTWGDNARRWGAGLADWEPLYFGLAGPGGGPIVRGGDGYWFLPASAEDLQLALRAGADLGGTRIEVASGSPAPTGIARADRSLGEWSYAFPGLDPLLPTAAAAAAAAVGDTLWLATEAGLSAGPPGAPWRTWSARAGLLGAGTALAVDGPRLWVGTRNGVALWDRSGETVVESWMRGREVTAIAVADDAVFVGAEEGLWAGRRTGAGLAPASLERVEATGGSVRALALDGATLYVATDTGLGVFDRASGAWDRIPVEGARLNGVPLDVAAADGQVWIGTARGLVRWRRATDEWRTYGEGDGLAGAPVLHVLADRDVVWASTPRGASRFAWRAADP